MMPIVSGHRGYKGKYPENTILGFTKCYETGATNFETDLYLTKDDVLVVSHDVNTKRTYVTADGKEADFNIPTSSYEEDLKDLRNKYTGDKMLTFKALCEFFLKNRVDKVEGERSVMLDIKTYNKPRILKNIIEELLSVKDDPNFWFKRLQFGVWDLDFVKYLNQDEYFQQLAKIYDINTEMQVVHISASCEKSIEFLGYNHYLDQTYGKERALYKTNGVSLVYLLTWSSEFLYKFIPVVKLENLALYTWTVNNTYQYDYFVKVCKSAAINTFGVLSDDPGLMMKHKQVTSYSTDKVQLEFKQKLAYFVFTIFRKFAPNKPLNYKSYVDPEKREQRPAHPIFIYVFYACQRLGIF